MQTIKKMLKMILTSVVRMIWMIFSSASMKMCNSNWAPLIITKAEILMWVSWCQMNLGPTSLNSHPSNLINPSTSDSKGAAVTAPLAHLWFLQSSNPRLHVTMVVAEGLHLRPWSHTSLILVANLEHSQLLQATIVATSQALHLLHKLPLIWLNSSKKLRKDKKKPWENGQSLELDPDLWEWK